MIRYRVCFAVIIAIAAFCLMAPAQDDSWHTPGQTIVESQPPDGIWFYSQVEDGVFRMTNKIRDERGLKTFEKEDALGITARGHSKDMLARNFFAHENPDGLSPFDRIAVRHRTLIGLTGENIYFIEGYDVSDAKKVAEMFMTGWMNSPPHRANILSEKYTRLGVGVAVKGDKVTATQNFAAVYAYLDNPLPETARRNAALDLRATPVSPDVVAPNRVDFAKLKSGKKAAGPFEIPGATADVKPGVYDTRFYFPVDRHNWTIVNGPRLEVVK